MTPRERVRRAIEHQAPDMVPLDLGSTSVTGIHAMAYRALRELMGTGGARRGGDARDGGRIRVIDPFQMLAEVEEGVRERLGVDTFGIQLPYTVFGFRNDRWKPWRLFDGTEVLVAGGIDTQRVLPFGTPEEVGDEVKKNVSILSECRGI